MQGSTLAETIALNQQYIEKCKEFLNSCLFKVNKDVLYDQINNYISDYVDLLKAIERSNLEPKYKQIFRSQTRQTFKQRLQNQTDLNSSHPAIIGTMINLFRAINRHYNLVNRA